MWVLGSGQKFPLPGHQLANIDAMTISAYTDHPRAALLDKLLENATNFDPEQRPTMQQFLREIDAWIKPPELNATSSHDMGAYRRLLEGRLRKFQENEQAAALANQRRDSEGLRIRERFRLVAKDLCQHLTEAGFLPPRLQIDNYCYGFEIIAIVPNVSSATKSHQIRVTLHSNPNADGSQFVLEAWYRHFKLEANQYFEKELWTSKRDFFSGGAEEEYQVLAMSHELSDVLAPAIEKVLAAAGVL
jgi:hypothetical protein